MNDDTKSANSTALPTIQDTCDAAREYVERGWVPIPIPRGKKSPVIDEWPQLRVTAADVDRHFAPDGNIGVLLGEASGNLVDVDLDCIEAVVMAPKLLPPTQAVFGHANNPDSHWLYIVDRSPSKRLALTDHENGSLVELRSTGGQTVFPPSIHPSGEPISWSGSGDPASISAVVLERHVRALAAATMFARHWPKDGRHPLSMAIGGALARAGYSADEVEVIVRAIGDYKRYPKIEDLVRTARDAVERVAQDRSAYGIPQLSELLGEPVAIALADILSFPKEDHDRGVTQRDRAIESLGGVEFWLTPGGEAYASVEVGGHVENHRIRSKAFRRIVQARAMAHEGRHVPKAPIEEALAFAEAQAAISGVVHEVHLRTARHGESIFIDLGGPNWQAVHVNKSGWATVDEPPVKFIRPPGLRPLPIPEAGGTLEDLRPFINVSEESDFRLFAAAMLAALNPDIPYPVLIVTGEQGTAKTTLSRIFKLLVDPHEVDARSPPRNEQDLFVGASHAHVLVFDNISHIPAWLSDTLCRISTGGAFAARELFTDREESLIKAKRPIVLNGIPFTVERPDLLDRAIILVLPVIPPEKRREEKEYWAEVERIRPKIFGLFLTALSTSLRNIDQVRLPSLPRMADLAKSITAAESAFGWKQGTFIQDFQERRTRSMRELADDIVVSTLRDLVRSRNGSMSMTASELLSLMNARVAHADRPQNWPRSPGRLSGQIRALAPALRELGIAVDQEQRRPSDNNRLIVLHAEGAGLQDDPIPF